ncbi:hypothetical protein ACFE04_004454 [Oxalis oulophora]
MSSSCYNKPQLQMSTTPLRAPTFISTRRILEENLQSLPKCTNLNKTKQLHAQIIKHNLHTDPYIVPGLISSLSLCNQTLSASYVFQQVNYPNAHLYNTMIKAYAHASLPLQALHLFFHMQTNAVYPDHFTYPFLLQAFNGVIQLVQMIHCHILKFGFSSDIYVPNALIDSYSKCGVLGVSAAKNLFITMDDRDNVSWNSMISGLVKSGEMDEARKLFDEMPNRDGVSWNTILYGCVKQGDMKNAFELFQQMPERNVVSWTTMISGFSKAGDIEMARMLFDKMPVKNLVTWTIIISGYAEQGLTKEAFALYNQMEAARLKPDETAFISILGACAESGLLGLGMKVHASIKGTRFHSHTKICNALVDMYAKCGNLDKALNVFNGSVNRDIVSWNVMILGLAMHGNGRKALQLFDTMKQENFKPDKITFIGVICACTHAGFVDRGVEYFHIMEKDYGVVPEIEHYGCMIDLLGKGGRLKDAFSLVNSMPYKPNAIIWGTLLGACRMHNAVGPATEALEHLVKLEPSDSGNYSMLSNIYAAAGDWKSAASVRVQMRRTGVEKESGASSIEVDDEVHEFTVFDKLHPNSSLIYEMTERLRQQLKQGEDDSQIASIEADSNYDLV